MVMVTSLATTLQTISNFTAEVNTQRQKVDYFTVYFLRKKSGIKKM